MNLPQEIQDNVLLLLDCETLKNCRDIQSDYVKKCTEFQNYDDAIEAGNLEILKWLHANTKCKLTDNQSSFAARHARIEILKWLLTQGLTFDCYTFQEAIDSGNFETVKFVYDTGYKCIEEGTADECECKDVFFKCAAEAGNLEVMKWFHELNFKANEWVFYYAVKNGNLDNMKWMHQVGIRPNSYTFKQAAEIGNLEVMKWLLEIGCPYNEITITASIVNGNLENLKWLIEHNFPRITDDMVFYAITNRKLEIFKWIVENLDDVNLTSKAYHRAAENEHVEILKFLKENNCPWDAKTGEYVIKNCTEDIFMWFLENGCPINTDVFEHAVKNENFKILNYIKDHKIPIEVQEIKQCIGYTKQMLEWLLNSGYLNKNEK